MAVLRKTTVQLEAWVRERDGIVHRDDALRAGFTVAVVRAFVREGRATMLRRAWLASAEAPADLRGAAHAGARLTCVSLARRRGWWIPESVSQELHLHLHPGSASSRPEGMQAVTHWSKPIVPAARSLVGTTEDALLHIAQCLDRHAALVLWESAARAENIAPQTLRAIRWPSVVARELADAVTGLSDSGLETLVAVPFRRHGLRVRQQVVLAGRPVDVLIGDRLVLQIDGYEFHSSSAQRSADIAHDAELRLRGFTVLRFSYAQVVHDWPTLERTVRRAVAAGLHLAA